MTDRTRRALVTFGLATAMAIPTAPARALSGIGGLDGELDLNLGLGGKFLDITVTLGQRRRLVLRLAQEYLAARDQGWKDPQGPGDGMAAIKKEGAKVATQAEAFAAGPAVFAAEAADTLHATEVDTGFVDDAKVEFEGNTATVTITSGTFLSWNDATLGTSSLSDTYVVTLERENRTWTVTKAAYVPTPSTAAPKAGATSTAASETADGVSTMAAHSYDRDAAVAYALRWSEVYKSSRGNHPVAYARNPEYEDLGGTNCANFVSQSLLAGGWTRRYGVNPDDPDNWDDNLNGPYTFSKTWTRANWLFDFAVKYRGYERNFWPPTDPTAGPGDPDFAIWELEPGDLIFTDWDTAVPDGVHDHVMIVTGTYTNPNDGFTEPTYSQNSPNRHNLPLSVGMKMAYYRRPSNNGDPNHNQNQPIFVPVKLKDSFDE